MLDFIISHVVGDIVNLVFPKLDLKKNDIKQL